MKKSVLLIISALALVAIVLIGLIFQRPEIFNVTIYVNEVVCTKVFVNGIEYDTYYDKSQNIYRVENPEKPETALTLAYAPGLTIDVYYAVLPNEATNQSVTFYTDPNSLIAQIDRNTGRITFIHEGTESFTIRANDNSNKSTRLRLRAKIPDA